MSIMSLGGSLDIGGVAVVVCIQKIAKLVLCGLTAGEAKKIPSGEDPNERRVRSTSHRLAVNGWLGSTTKPFTNEVTANTDSSGGSSSVVRRARSCPGSWWTFGAPKTRRNWDRQKSPRPRIRSSSSRQGWPGHPRSSKWLSPRLTTDGIQWRRQCPPKTRRFRTWPGSWRSQTERWWCRAHRRPGLKRCRH